MNFFLIKTNLIGLFICCSFSLSAQSLELTKSSADDSDYYEPLEEVVLTGAEGATVKVFDGVGMEYFSVRSAPVIHFKIAGNAGAHEVAVFDGNNKEIARKKFTVKAKTSIDDGGEYKDMFNLFYKGMCVYSPNGVEESTFFGKTYHYFVSWGLDHYHTMKGMQYFSPVGSEYLDLMRKYQRKDGMIWSFIQTGNRHYYETCYGPFGYFGPYDDNYFLARQPIENHCEYIYVNSVYMVWKASGDSAWMKNALPSCAKALDYSITDPARYSQRLGLLKRVYTIDSWDFQVMDKYLPDIGLTNRMLIHPEKSKFGIFYGDNTGYADACKQLAEMFERTGDKNNAEKYSKRSAEISDRINKLAWNGRFFSHFIEEDNTVVRNLGVDESTQVSLSNAYTVNRKGITHQQSKAIIQTYLNLKNNLPKGSPGEWYAIYPPFERGFGDDNHKWQYMNGGVAGHAAGELARGAYENGYETYATDILTRLQKLGHSVGDRIWFAYTGSFPDPPVPDYTTLDLTKYANMNLSSWMETEPSDSNKSIAGIPAGKQTFAGIPFYLTEPVANANRSAIGISTNPDYSNKVEIAIDKPAACVYLMHSGAVRGTDEVYGCITFDYEDGSDESIYLMRGKQIAQLWYPSVSNPYSGVAWRGPNAQTGDVGVYWTAIDNPAPEKKIKKLVFTPNLNKGLYVLIGITLSDQPHYVKPSVESGGGPDNWAASTAMYALIHGLAGMQDKDAGFRSPLVAPRWTATSAEKVKATACYPASGGYIAYEYELFPVDRKMVFDIAGNAPSMEFHVLLPREMYNVSKVLSNGKTTPYTCSSIEESKYVDFTSAVKGVQHIEILLNK